MTLAEAQRRASTGDWGDDAAERLSNIIKAAMAQAEGAGEDPMRRVRQVLANTEYRR